MNNKNSGKQTLLQNPTPELLFQCSFHLEERERGPDSGWLTSEKLRDIEPPSANPCFPSPAIKKVCTTSSDVGGFIRTDLSWESVVERQMRGLLRSTLLGFAANSNSVFENSLKLKKVIFLSATTLLWGVSANVDLTEGVRMCFLLQLLPNTNTFDCVYQDHVCICGCLYPGCRHLHGWHK